MRRTPHPRGGDFAHPLNISDILSVCHDRQDLLPGIFARLRERHRYGDLPPWSYIRLRNSNLKFYIEGRFVGRYDRRRQLRRIVFLFRNTEEEITRKFILGMALSQTKIFPWFFDLGHNRMVIDERWFAHLGLPAGDGTIGTEDFFRLVHPEDAHDRRAAAKAQNVPASAGLPPVPEHGAPGRSAAQRSGHVRRD